MKKVSAFLLIVLIACAQGFSKNPKGADKKKKLSRQKNKVEKTDDWLDTELDVHQELAIWKKSYPDVGFELNFDEAENDWTIKVTNYGKSTTFYWADGLYLTKDQLANKDHYWRVITKYDNEILDPLKMTPEQVERVRHFGSDENRKNGKVSSKLIFNAILDARTRRSTESHIEQIKFLTKYSNVHEYIVPALKRVEEKILELSETDSEIKNFVEQLASAEAFNWREIRDTSTRSFHSYGIALDILPKGWGKKIVYWGFEKAEGNKDWMLIPLEKRWMPPEKVRDIFMEEGFIWGGTWAVWDNMHFEYHPEQIVAGKKKAKSH